MKRLRATASVSWLKMAGNSSAFLEFTGETAVQLHALLHEFRGRACEMETNCHRASHQAAFTLRGVWHACPYQAVES